MFQSPTDCVGRQAKPGGPFLCGQGYTTVSERKTWSAVSWKQRSRPNSIAPGAEHLSVRFVGRCLEPRSVVGNRDRKQGSKMSNQRVLCKLSVSKLAPVVQRRVSGPRQHRKVVWSVVRGIFVLVMNTFVWGQRASNKLFGYKDVFADISFLVRPRMSWLQTKHVAARTLAATFPVAIELTASMMPRNETSCHAVVSYGFLSATTRAQDTAWTTNKAWSHDEMITCPA